MSHAPIWLVSVGCTDYYCHGDHLVIGAYSSRELAEAAPIPDEIDGNKVDTFTGPSVLELEVDAP